MGRARTTDENNTSWQVTSCNAGLLINKAYAAVLCNALVPLITAVVSSRGRCTSMGRGRTTENNTNRQVTLCSDGLLKKAIAVLCNAMVALTVVFSGHGRLLERANNSDKKMVKLLIVIAIFMGTHLTPAVSTTPTYWAFFCAGGNFTPSSTYARSLGEIAAVLPKRAAFSPLLFADSHSGEVHAIAQCRGDSSALACARCTAGCLRDARKLLCPFKQGAVVFSELCSVSYYQKELLQYPTGNELDVTASMSDFSPVTLQGAAFNTSVRELAKAVARMTTASPTHFGTGQIEVVQEQYGVTIYGLGQCLPTLSAEDCEECLIELFYAIDVAIDMTTGRVAKVWCNYRFALYKFFRGKSALDLPAEVLFVGMPKKRGKKHHNQQKDDTTTSLVAAVAVLGTLLLLSVVAWLVYWWRNRNQHKKSSEVQCTGKAVESALETFQDIVDLANNKEIAVFLDYDGTLCAFVNDPEKAYMSSEMHQVLRSITENFKISIVTGRLLEKIYGFVQIPTINYAGCHGNDIKMAPIVQDAEITEDSYQPAKEFATMINQVYNSLVREIEDINGAMVENNRYYVSVHYRNVAKEDQPRVRPVVEEVVENLNNGLILKEEGLILKEAHMVYEVRPTKVWNKGDAVCYILDKLELDNDTSFFSIYIGDDLSDEDAFKVIRDKNKGIGILVSKTSRQTSAFYSLKDPPQVMEFLKLLVKWKLKNIK